MKVRKKQQNINSALLYLILMVAFVTIIILITIFVFIEGDSTSDTTGNTTPTPIASPTERPIESIDVILKADSIQVEESDLDIDKEYSFEITKSPSSTCEGIRSTELGYTIAIYGNSARIPFKPASKGDYTFECIGQKTSFTVSVE